MVSLQDDIDDQLNSMSQAQMAMEMIKYHKLNEEVRVGDRRCKRFIPIDKKGNKVNSEESIGIYDMQYGKAFLPQIDSDWINQLAERYRISNIWMEENKVWESQIHIGNMKILASAKTIGEAQVRAMMTAAILKLKPKKEEWIE